jgi:hypothetical protein
MFTAGNVWSNLRRAQSPGTNQDGGEADQVRQLTRTVPDGGQQCDSAEGLVTLHGACATLLRAPEQVVRSMVVLLPLGDFPMPPTSLVDLAERIASEYGLSAEATLDEQHLRVRLARPATVESRGKRRGPFARRE